MDKLAAMRTLVRVAEAGSFSAVAHQTGTTQSAVSKQVAALERELGATLLARSTRSLSLTDAGVRYVDQARRLLAEIEDAEAALRGGEGSLRGWLRVASSVGFGRLKVLPLVQRFLQLHPDLRVDLRLHDGFVDLVEQGIDLSLRIGELENSGLVARRVGTSDRQLVAHRDYLRSLPRTLPPPRRPEDLARHECLVYTERVGRNLWSFHAGAGADAPVGSVRSVRVEGRLQTDSSEVMRAAVLSGMGIGYSPTWMFEDELAAGTVVRLLPDWTPPSSPVHAVYPPQRRHSAKVRAFSDFVAAAWSGA